MGYNRESIKPTNHELEDICKTLKKEGIVVSLLSVTYVTHVQDVLAYEYYECFSFPIPVTIPPNDIHRILFPKSP